MNINCQSLPIHTTYKYILTNDNIFDDDIQISMFQVTYLMQFNRHNLNLLMELFIVFICLICTTKNIIYPRMIAHENP